MSQPGKCIFCGKGGLTKEHIFSKWISRLLSSPPFDARGLPHHTDHLTDLYQFQQDGQIFQADHNFGKLHRPGRSISQTLRVVCRECNNGWMSRVVERASATVAAVIQGDWSLLDANSVSDVALWVAVTAIIIEQADPRTMSKRQDELHFMHAFCRIPLNWKILLATHDGSIPDGFWHRGFGSLGERRTNGITCFFLGKAIFVVINSTDNPSVVHDLHILPGVFDICLYPYVLENYSLPMLDGGSGAPRKIVLDLTESLGGGFIDPNVPLENYRPAIESRRAPQLDSNQRRTRKIE